MARASRALAVWANGVRVGLWSLPSRGPTEFAYDEDWLAADESRPLSLSLPLTLHRTTHKGAAVEAYFDNLLQSIQLIPEGGTDRVRIDAPTARAAGFEATLRREASRGPHVPGICEREDHRHQ